MKPLATIDPRAVPLPHGTEVSTRVDRTHPTDPERRVPQGAIGRVVSSQGDAYDVAVVGVGTLRYARDEILPRRVGQVRWAERRAASWDALKPCVVLEATVGSRAWGLADEGSDTDLRGVFALPLTWTVGLAEPPADLVSADGSATYWEIGKAIRQALRADPNTLELLFVPSARALDPIGQWLLDARDAFVSTEIFGSFGRHALSQLGKLTRSMRLAEHRTTVLEWLRDDPDAKLDAIAARLAQRIPGDDSLLRARDYLKQLYRSMHDQGLLDANDFTALVRFARERSTEFELPRELRPKNAYNLLRLVATATEWLRVGEPRLEVSGPLRDRLLAIKRGEVPLDDVLAEAESMTPTLEAARDVSPLPREPDYARADELLRRARLEIARRWAASAPGPFGESREPATQTSSPDLERVTGSKAFAVMMRVVGEEAALRRHIVVSLSGAHAYGFPSPDSDLDLKGIHVRATSELLGLGPAPTAPARLGIEDDVEIDYTSNEIEDVLRSILNGNGNYVERVLGSLFPLDTPWRASLAPLVRRSLSRRIHRHYRGFATSQLRSAEESTCTAKKMLYVLRTTLTGAHTLRTGELVIDVTQLLDESGFAHARELLEIKKTGERAALPDDARTRWLGEVRRAFDVLDAARDASVLPEEPTETAFRDLDAWLLALRREML
jgi:predicted nucleotidyltransferase